MTKFNVGDKVKVIAGYTDDIRGRIGVVTDVDSTGVHVASNPNMPKHRDNGDDFHLFFWVSELEPIPTTPEVGTLAEIGAQVGDVVEVTQWIGDMFSKGDTGVVVSGFHHSGGSFGIASGAGNFRIISRASDASHPVELSVDLDEAIKQVVAESQSGPVQLRKVIVPGVYGKVSIGNWNGCGDFVPVKIATEWTLINGDKDIGHAIMSHADLIAARDVFNALIDAMPDAT